MIPTTFYAFLTRLLSPLTLFYSPRYFSTELCSLSKMADRKTQGIFVLGPHKYIFTVVYFLVVFLCAWQKKEKLKGVFLPLNHLRFSSTVERGLSETCYNSISLSFLSSVFACAYLQWKEVSGLSLKGERFKWDFLFSSGDTDSFKFNWLTVKKIKREQLKMLL